jgi:hypothetical protein
MAIMSINLRIFKLIKKKVFCVGANKTGTTSIGEFLNQAGYNVAPQIPAEKLIHDWAKRDFKKLFLFCKKYDAFQDIPFSLDYTYQFLDFKFPNSKFILTVRNSPDEWLESYIRFTNKILNGKEINRSNLSSINYIYPGYFLDSLDCIYGRDTPLFDEKVYKQCYTLHNLSVIKYFEYRPEKLLVLNLSDPDGSHKLCSFLNLSHKFDLPHLNSSK